MRADRLLSFLMLLQSRGRMTAEDVASELGVSVRTVYRDIEALSMTGVPIYAESGPGGGIGLMDSYRTDLTGLSEDETRALFMLSIPDPLAQLGVEKDLRGALLKLSAALPARRRAGEDEVKQRVHVDSSWWFNRDECVPQLTALRDAVWRDRTIQCRCEMMHRFEIPLRLDPYGLVAKGGVWHLVAGLNGKIRVYRVSQLSEVILTDERFDRPDGFDLARFWKDYCAEHERSQALYLVRLRTSSDLVGTLSLHLGPAAGTMQLLASENQADTPVHTEVGHDGDALQGGRVSLRAASVLVQVGFESLEAARRLLLGLGRAVEVLEPEALRDSMRDYAEQILSVYRREAMTTGKPPPAIRSQSMITMVHTSSEGAAAP